MFTNSFATDDMPVFTVVSLKTVTAFKVQCINFSGVFFNRAQS